MIIRCPSCGAENRIPIERAGDRARCGACKAALPAPDAPVELHDDASFDEAIGRAKLPVLVDFWAPWCGPCRMVSPEVAKLAKERAGRVLVAKVNTDEVPGVASRYGIRSIPTMIVFRGGREAKRVSGAMPAPQLAAALGV